MTGASGEDLVRRYVEDRDSLSDREALALLEWLREDSSRTKALRDDLVLDELLSRQLAVDRGNFPAQVRQRVADWLRGERSLDEKAAELRRIAQGQLGEYGRGRSNVQWTWIVALAAVVALVAASPWLWSLGDPALARVDSIEGEAFARSGAQRRALRAGDVVRATDEITAPDGSRVALAYDDGTDVTLEGGSTARLARFGARGAKRVRLDSGELTADVAKQPTGEPMTFVTPHAEATVLGTELLLEVGDEMTRLEVREGRVAFRRTLPPRGAASQSAVVESDQSGVSAGTGLVVEEGLWPTRRLGLAFLYRRASESEQDDPATGETRRSTPTPRGRAWTDPFGRLACDGGGFDMPAEDSRTVRDALAESGAFSLQATVLLRAPTDQRVSLVEFGGEDAASPAFALRLDGRRLSFAATLGPGRDAQEGTAPIDASLVERDLGELPINDASHWIVTFASGRLHAYRDGTLAFQEDGLAEALVVSDDARLTFGPSARSEAVFDGALESIAIHDRQSSPREARRDSLELQRARSLRPEESFARLRVEPTARERIDRWLNESLANLDRTTLIVLPLRRTDAPSPERATILAATILDPSRPGERERIVALLSNAELAGIPLARLPGLAELPRLELTDPALSGEGPEFFLDGTGD